VKSRKKTKDKMNRKEVKKIRKNEQKTKGKSSMKEERMPMNFQVSFFFFLSFFALFYHFG
jgi:hypothetical protein